MIEQTQLDKAVTFTIRLPALWSARRAMPRTARWLAEIAGVAALAVAAGLWQLPAGIAVGGVYLIIAANSGGE
jgi:hypothetical protein